MFAHKLSISESSTLHPIRKKFTPNPALLFAFFTNSGPAGTLPFKSVSTPRKSLVRDTFYDYRTCNLLTDRRKWLRNRNGVWEMMYGNDVGLRSVFSVGEIWTIVKGCSEDEGVDGALEHGILCRGFDAQKGLGGLPSLQFGLDVWADIRANRTTVTVDGVVDASIDEVAGGVYGEIEMREKDFLVDDGGLEPYLERYKWFFEGEHREGKLTKYFREVQDRAVDKGVDREIIGNMAKVLVYERAMGIGRR